MDIFNEYIWSSRLAIGINCCWMSSHKEDNAILLGDFRAAQFHKLCVVKHTTVEKVDCFVGSCIANIDDTLDLH